VRTSSERALEELLAPFVHQLLLWRLLGRLVLRVEIEQRAERELVVSKRLAAEHELRVELDRPLLRELFVLMT